MGRVWWRIWRHLLPQRTKAEALVKKLRRSALGVEGLEDRSIPSAGQLQFAAGFVSVAENAGNATITVNRTGGTDGVVTVQFNTADGTAATGADYTAQSGVLTFVEGQASSTFTVPILNDSAVEGNETIKLTLSSPGEGATLGSPSTAFLSIKDNDGTQTQRFVATTFLDLLHRPPAAAGLEYWSRVIDNGNVSRAQLANIIVKSAEYRKLEVTDAFQSILGRNPVPKTLNSFSNALAVGMTLETLESKLYGSAEYFTKVGGTNSSFLNALYLNTVGKPIDATTLNQYMNMLANGGSRENVAASIMKRTDSIQFRVNNYFNEFLHRDANQTNLTNQGNALKNGLRDEQLIVRLVGSVEYFGNVA